jgi:4-amino-4-deoxy-L-arabinose transferase-like glycosyltransferase
VSRPRTLDERIEKIRPEYAPPRRARTRSERPPGVRRFWGVIPVVVIALLFAVRAWLHTPPLDNLAPVASEPSDPAGLEARAGSIAITRGGPVIIGFQSDTPARLVFGGQEIRGKGLVTKRVVVMHGPAAIRFAGPPDARLVWSPVGRRGDPEYVPASSLAPVVPAQATFDSPGAAPLDGAIALAILATAVASLCLLARRRLAAVSRNTWLGMGAILVVALGVRLVGLGDQGQTWDEEVNWAAGKNYVTNVLALDFSERSWGWNFEHPPVMKLLAGIGAQFSDGFGVARALSALWVALGCALLVPIGTRLYRFRVGMLAGAIAALLPPLVAHGQIVGHEAPTVLWWALGILLSLGAHDYLPADDRRALRVLLSRLAGIGIVIGVAIASRFVNGLLGPLCAVIVVLQAPRRWRTATLGWGAVLMPLTAIVTIYALWPRLWEHPIANLQLAFAKLGKLHAEEPFLGELTSQPGPGYFAIYLVATLPIGILGAVVAWFGRSGVESYRAIRSRSDRWAAADRVPSRERVRAAIIVFAWLVIPLAGIMLSPVRQDGVRYVMPCVLVFAVIAAAGFDGLAMLVEKRRRLGRTFHALAGVVVLYLGFTIVRTAPYYLDYFGEHTGGAGAVAESRTFETAWWGEGLDRAVAYVNEHAAPNDRVLTPSACIVPYHMAWFREDLWATITPSANQARWIVSYAPATKSCALPADARKVYEVTHDGVTLAAVYRRD